MQRLSWGMLSLLLVLLLVTGCSDQSEGETPEPEATSVAPIPTAAGAGEQTEDAATQPPPTGTRLVVWTVPEISPRSEVPGGSTLAEQLAAYDNTNPGLTLEIDFKAESGPASTLNYLRAGQNVAPDILPDLILIPFSQLGEAVETGLVFPFSDPATGESLIDPALVEDLYPAADRLGRLNVEDGPLYGYPFVLRNVSHLAYNEGALDEGAPQTWSEFAAGGGRLIFPADGPEGALLLLQLYLAAGGGLLNEAGQSTLQAEPLIQALSTLEQGRRSGAILLESSNVRSFEQAWDAFAAGTGNATLTDVHQFLGVRGPGDGVAVFAVPGLTGPLPPLVDGWVWALATTDADRQQAAVNLIRWLTAPENIGVWSREASYVPARRNGLAAWSGDDSAYFDFIDAQLANAQPVPNTFTPAIEDALAIALFDVVSLARTPGSATQEALDLLRP